MRVCDGWNGMVGWSVWKGWCGIGGEALRDGWLVRAFDDGSRSRPACVPLVS